MSEVAKEVIKEMKNYNYFNGWSLYVYQFSVNNKLKNNLIDNFLNSLSTAYNYQLLNLLAGNTKLNQPKTAVLFLVTSFSDFEALLNLNYPEDVPKIIAYFFTPAEFQKISDENYRRSFKARCFYLIYPNKFTDNIIHACSEKILDTIFVRTIRNKFRGSLIGKDIATYTQISPDLKIAKMRELGWYLRDNELNHSESLAGAIAIRFSKGSLINASKTDKYNIDRNHVCYVENCIPEKNKIEFIGDFMPSSESLVPHLAFQEFPQMNIMLHFHYKPMTYSLQLDFYRTEKYLSYGTMEEAEMITAKLRETGSFVIANGHGEFVFGKNILEIEQIINNIIKIINTH